MGMKDSILKLNIQQRWGSVEKEATGALTSK
jgi:hypothetical protein